MMIASRPCLISVHPSRPLRPCIDASCHVCDPAVLAWLNGWLQTLRRYSLNLNVDLNLNLNLNLDTILAFTSVDALGRSRPSPSCSYTTLSLCLPHGHNSLYLTPCLGRYRLSTVVRARMRRTRPVTATPCEPCCNVPVPCRRELTGCGYSSLLFKDWVFITNPALFPKATVARLRRQIQVRTSKEMRCSSFCFCRLTQVAELWWPPAPA